MYVNNVFLAERLRKVRKDRIFSDLIRIFRKFEVDGVIVLISDTDSTVGTQSFLDVFMDMILWQAFVHNVKITRDEFDHLKSFCGETEANRFTVAPGSSPKAIKEMIKGLLTSPLTDLLTVVNPTY